MSPTHRSFLRILPALAVGLLSLTSPQRAFAQTYQWNQTNTGTYDWFTAGNWTNGSVPNGTNAFVKFNQTGYLLAGNVTITVNSNITVAAFQNVDTLGGTLTLEGSGTITLKDNSTGVAYIDTKGINQTINNALVLDDPNGVRISGAKSAWLKGNVSGASAISLYGTVYLGGNNSFSGNVTISNLTAGQFIATATNAFINATNGTYAFRIDASQYNTASIGTVAQGTTTFANALDLGNSAAGNSRITFLSGGTNSVLEITTSSWANTGGTGEIQINRAGTDSFVGYTASGIGTVKFSGTDFTVAKNISGGGGSSMLEFAPASGTQTWSGNITNFTQKIVKSGAGTVVLSGTNTYTGATDVTAGTLQIGSGGTSGTLGTNNVTISNGATLAFNRSDALSVSNAFSGAGNLTKSGAGTLTLATNSTYTGATTISAGEIALGANGKLSTSTALNLSGSSSRFDISGITASGSTNGSLAGVAGSVVNLGSKNLNVGGDNASTTFAGVLTNTGSLTKSGTGTLTLSGSNSYTGTMTVSAGVLNLDSSFTGGAAGSVGAVSVATNAVLLISKSNQINDGAAVTLSGGTIRRASDVSEVFGNLTLSSASFLDFGSGALGSISFGSYAPSSLLTVQNFFPGNGLSFTSNLTSTIENTNLFRFDGAFTYDWNSQTSLFTITAIPEASTLVVVIGLAGVMLWPARRRLPKTIRDTRRS